MKKFLLTSLLAVFTATTSLVAADATPATPAAAPAKKAPKAQSVPFRGKLVSIDKMAKTITVGERVFQITSQTRLAKAGKPCALDDAVVGDEVGGAYKTAADGKLEALSVRFGAKPEATPKAKPEKKPAAK